MKHLFDCLKGLNAEFQEKHIMLFLDYDGTLTPIVPKPEAAQLSDSMRRLLSELVEHKELSIAIVSGRSLDQVRFFVGVPDILYIGNHGFEIEGPNFRHTHPGALDAKEIMREVAEALARTLKPMPGILIENKIFTLSIHYRQIPQDKIDRVRMVFLKTLHPFLELSKIIFTEGKKVLEVRPALGWNKGTAVAWLYGRKLASDPGRKILPIYIGDDNTDEAALKAMKNCGIGIKVSEDIPESHADYYLRNPDEIHEFLKYIQKIKIHKT